MHVQSEVAAFDQIGMPSSGQVGTQIKGVQCVACSVVLSTDGVAFILIHFISSRKESLVGSDKVPLCLLIECRFQGGIGDLFSVDVNCQEVDVHVLKVEGVFPVATVKGLVGHASHYDAGWKLSEEYVVLG